jgi:hypothetical protein
MIIIEYDMIQCAADNIILRYRDDVPWSEWSRLTVDMRTLGLLLKYWGLFGCVYMPGKRPNLDNGTCNNSVPMQYCGAEMSLPCGAGTINLTPAAARAFNVD